MTERVLFIHYTPPAVIGGVEHIMQEHARLLEARGYEVHVAAGRPQAGHAGLEVIPQIDSAGPRSVLVEQELEDGVVSNTFYAMRDEIVQRLAPLMGRADAVIAHNAFTLHFNLPLTAALWHLADTQPGGHTIAWCHDLAWTNPLYIPAMHEGYPWNLLRLRAPNTTYVTISEERRRELCALWGGPCDSISVIPNGIAVDTFLHLSNDTQALARDYDLFDRDLVLLLPVRITRRKNVEIGIRVVRCLKERGLNAVFLISGPQAPHHPGRSATYLEELKALRTSLSMDDHVVFLADAVGANLDVRTVSELYMLADVLFFPSAQEGFGLPILEAGLRRIPIVLSDIPIFRELGGGDVTIFGLDESADRIAEKLIMALDTGPSRLYRRVLRDYRWDAIVDRKMVPLLQQRSTR